MKHRYALLGAIAIGLMVCFLLVGRVRADTASAGRQQTPSSVPAIGVTWR